MSDAKGKNPIEPNVEDRGTIDDEREFDEYEFYRQAFRDEIAGELVDRASQRASASLGELHLELQYARSCFLAAEGRSEGTGRTEYLATFVLTYRVVDWFRSELQNALVNALTEPFADTFAKFKNRSARWLLARDAIDALTKEVLEKAGGKAGVADTLANFLRKYAPIRHQVMHGIRIPTSDECRACLSDAAKVQWIAEDAFAGGPVAKFDISLIVVADPS